jgi:ParB/RepB/Spo0J family partition protein
MASPKIEGVRRVDSFIVKDPDLIGVRDDFNHRVVFDDIRELADNIKERGVITPLLIRRNKGEVDDSFPFWLVAGERRLQALRLLKKEGVEIEFKVNIDTTTGDKEALIISAIENIQREGINPVEESTVVLSLDGLDMADKDIAAHLGRTTQWVGQRRTLGTASDALKDAVLTKQIPVDVALDLARDIPLDKQAEKVAKILEKAKGKSSSVRKAASEETKKTVRPGKKEFQKAFVLLGGLIDLDPQEDDLPPEAELVKTTLDFAMGEMSFDAFEEALSQAFSV